MTPVGTDASFLLDLSAAVRRVAPVLDVHPESIDIPAGLIARARRRGGPALLALRGPHLMLVVYFDHFAVDEAGRAGAAFEALPPAVRAACHRLVVGWPAADGVRVAAFPVDPSGPRPEPVATSWTSRHGWPAPTVDAALSGEAAITAALDDLRAALATSSADASERAVASVGLALRAQGGEPIDAVAPWALGAQAQQRWLDRYAHAVRGEWRRATGAPGSPADVVRISPAATGPLRGWTVFVSYARRDAVTLALPVSDALAAAGATVWVDQAENPDPELLDAGLAEVMAGCDAYVACVSDEFFERAGYSTQELAWALEQSDGSRARALVSKSETMVPRLVAGWPAVTYDGTPGVDLAGPIAGALLSGDARREATLPPAEPAPPVLDDELDPAGLRGRARHVQRFLDIRQEQFEAIATGQPDDRRAAAARELLLDPGAGLDWSGHLHDIADWPADPLVRDMRWRLGVMRVVASVRWPLSGVLGEPADIADDVDRLLLHPHPALAWPSVPGWADDERRLAIRYQLSLFRLLGTLLERGLDAGLIHVDDRRREPWADAVRERRQECLDALVDLRLRRRLGWHADRPVWDGVYRRVLRILRETRAGWNDAVPGTVDALIRACADDVAAAAAETFWVASRTGRTVTRPVPVPRGRARGLLVWAGRDEPAPDVVAVGLTPGPDGGADFLVSWPGAAGGDGRVRVREDDFAEAIRFTS